MTLQAGFSSGTKGQCLSWTLDFRNRACRELSLFSNARAVHDHLVSGPEMYLLRLSGCPVWVCFEKPKGLANPLASGRDGRSCLADLRCCVPTGRRFGTSQWRRDGGFPSRGLVVA